MGLSYTGPSPVSASDMSIKALTTIVTLSCRFLSLIANECDMNANLYTSASNLAATHFW